MFLGIIDPLVNSAFFTYGCEPWQATALWYHLIFKYTSNLPGDWYSAGNHLNFLAMFRTNIRTTELSRPQGQKVCCPSSGCSIVSKFNKDCNTLSFQIQCVGMMLLLAVTKTNNKETTGKRAAFLATQRPKLNAIILGSFWAAFHGDSVGGLEARG